MHWKEPTLKATLIKRYKRFLVDLTLPDGSLVTAHTTNTGSMKGLLGENTPALITRHPGENRKLLYTLQALKPDKVWVGCNTSLPPLLAKEAIETGMLKALRGYSQFQTEIKYGINSRIDILLSGHPKKPNAYIEVKNVTLKENEKALFPDAVSQRGQKHLKELMSQVQLGFRGAMLYVIQRPDCRSLSPAIHIDPVYADLMAQAQKEGVEMYAIDVEITPEKLQLKSQIPVEIEICR